MRAADGAPPPSRRWQAALHQCVSNAGYGALRDSTALLQAEAKQAEVGTRGLVGGSAASRKKVPPRQCAMTRTHLLRVAPLLPWDT